MSGYKILLATIAACVTAQIVAAGPVEYIGADEQSGSSRAVAVDGQALAHTGQVLPLDKQGQVIGPDSADTQLAQVLFNLETALAAVGSGTEHLVKMNLYVDGPRTAAKIKRMFAKRFPAPVRPAMSWVCTPLPYPGVIVALDAVAVVPDAGSAKVIRTRCEALAGDSKMADVAVLPRGDAVYVSGMSAKGDMASATADTMNQLMETIGLLGLKSDQVVQLKAFVGSMDEAQTIRKEMAKTFSGRVAPPAVLVEWTTTGSVEIEMIVAAGPRKSDASPSETVSYFTPPGVKPSPVYSKVACVHGGKRIYISGMHSAQPGDGTAQVTDVFAAIESIVKESGTDMRHLVKATYYVSDKDPSAMLNKLRPNYYDPQRPPAASKAMVLGVGMADRTLSIDMIAVTPE
jgi:enamine deaminase RidA (YjgF/YER057c/UK114 family)